MILLILILFVLVIVLSYTTFINFKKVEEYEIYIKYLHSKVYSTLSSMREIDSSNMFESDDDVGSIFKQLVDILGELRPLIYGLNNAKEEN
jgi:hypothetical protein